ncbi:hypothetical protein AAV35_012820 [Salimicrobium jeotgali]|uniref:Uncharacterized protein n=1 Tax=Salimicrobium jeotgali TaxID=1230341 RepID=K2G7S1_9BACI|nr:hypothetical protein [Salimicrobium jeotgali]AKG05544.1 hypothetical protein AAV35_012820 [Salimicrobium jeotgali]EKE30462.1 hypothetical protein MJ3_13514 [Salimicrobium jeotgali]MBM7696607.1 hypothetical protein [Salimicrobium jeotgali]
MATSIHETFRNIAMGALESVLRARKGIINKLESWGVASEINDKKKRLLHIENTLLPVTKKSVRRKKLLQEQKQLRASIQDLRADYHHLRNQTKRNKPIDADEIDTTIMNLKGWHREKK